VAAAGAALPVVRAYEAFLQQKEQERSEAEQADVAPPVGTDGRRPARFTDVFVHDGSGYPRAEFGSEETVAVDLSFETEDPSLAFQLRVGADREDGVQAFAVDTRAEAFAPLTGRRHYRLRLVFPQLPIAQGQFRLYAFLGDENALHLHDLRVLRPGFTVVSPDYAVGLVKPRHLWTVVEGSGHTSLPVAAGSSTASS
jgi:hypothetical protein